MTTALCPLCGRDEGHYIGCARIPRSTSVPDPEEYSWSLCAEDGCDDPVKDARNAKYCPDHGTPAAVAARAKRKKEEADV